LIGFSLGALTKSQLGSTLYSMKLPWRMFGFLTATLWIFSPCSRASCPVPGIRPSGEYYKSDVVFTGTVISVRYTNRDVGGWFYRIRVGKVFRGPAQDEFTVYTEDSDIRFPLEKNRSYLLFAYRRNARLEIDSCGNSSLLSKAEKSIRILEAISLAPPYGEIEGWVVGETGGIDVSGVRVTIRGRTRSYSTVTDKDGWFHIRAPIGMYRVDFSSRKYYLNAADDFWYDPDHFTLHAGETASLQLVSVRHLRK